MLRRGFMIAFMAQLALTLFCVFGFLNWFEEGWNWWEEKLLRKVTK
jgi:hypothetical protein